MLFAILVRGEPGAKGVMMALDLGTVPELALKRQLRGLLLAGCCVALLGGCSSFDDWLAGEDNTSGAAETANAAEAEAEDDDYPKIADIPESPRQGLVADSGNAQYSDQNLRAEVPGSSQRVVTRSPAGQPQTVPQTASTTRQASISSENVTAPAAPAPAAQPAARPAPQPAAAAPARPVPGSRPAPQGQSGLEPQIAQTTGGQAAQAGPSDRGKMWQTRFPGGTSAAPQTAQAPRAPVTAGGGQALYDRGNSPVTVNLDAIGAGPQIAQAPAYSPGQAAGPSYGGVPAGGTQVAVIQFGYGSASVDGQDREVLRQVVALQRQYGGTLQVVGHASAKTGVMPVAQHHAANLQISQARANAVREVLVAMGAPANGVGAQGAGDTQPLYGEMMATGEAGNRRADIYLVR